GLVRPRPAGLQRLRRHRNPDARRGSYGATGVTQDSTTRPSPRQKREAINGSSPHGLVLEPAFLDEPEERCLPTRLEAPDFHEIVLHGVAARRTARHYGVSYDYERRASVAEAEPLPTWLEPLRARGAALAGVEPAALVEALVQHYPVGATIGWH